MATMGSSASSATSETLPVESVVKTTETETQETPDTPFERELAAWKAKGSPEDGEDSARGYLRPAALTYKKWYKIEHNKGLTWTAEFWGEETVNLPNWGMRVLVFYDQYGARLEIPTNRVKPVSRLNDYYVSGPVQAEYFPFHRYGGSRF